MALTRDPESWRRVQTSISTGDPQIDAMGIFHAYTRDEWNGFVAPHFTEAEGKRIVAWTRAMVDRFGPDGVETVTWDEAGKCFLLESFEEPHLPGEPVPTEDVVTGGVVEELGLTLYGIGAYRWTWEEVANVPLADPVPSLV